MVTMQQDGILKVLEGKTTFDEVKSATGEISW
jgi:type II secretory ATPase GspE/PulE/Tfp pilus assembly ATPase PilB-like protein